MNCEMCGKEIEGKPLRAKIEGSLLLVCSDCAKFGRVQRDTPHERNSYLVTRKAENRLSPNPNLSVKGFIQEMRNLWMSSWKILMSL